MAYTPVELRHISLKRGFRGYRRGPVDQLLTDIADSFEAVWRERADLADRVEQVEGELTHHRERERLLSNTLLAAERAAVDAKLDAHRQGEQIVAEAHAEARSITRGAIAEREKLRAENRRVRSLLRSALDVLEADEPEAEAPAAAGPEPAAAPAAWPARDDTREFAMPRLPALQLSAEPPAPAAQPGPALPPNPAGPPSSAEPQNASTA